MALHVDCSDPDGLLERIKGAIDSGGVTDWSYDEDGDLSHTPRPWLHKAWFCPKTNDDLLTLSIVPPLGTPLANDTYAVYHARFVEMLLLHFDHYFENVRVTALPEHGDSVE